MTKLSGWQRFAAATGAAFALLLAAGCETTPAFQVSQPSSRDGTVESIVQDTVQSGNAAVGTIGGAVVGGLLGHQVGGGTGKTLATIGGAAAGGYAGNEVQKHVTKTTVWVTRATLKDGSVRTFETSADPGFKVDEIVNVDGNALKRR